MATPHPAICWTSSYKSRKTPTLPHLAQWGLGQGPDRAQGPDQDPVPAVVHQQAELRIAEQVRTSKNYQVYIIVIYFLKSQSVI